MVDDDEFNEKVLHEIQGACQKGGVEKYETPQRAKVVPDAWTPETGLVTDALKLKRKAIEQKYKDDIDKMYQGQSQSNGDQSKKKKEQSKESTTEVGDDAAANDDDKKDQ